jgi:mannose-6-phosphate isomerase-like protein (cupin superfamily)
VGAGESVYRSRAEAPPRKSRKTPLEVIEVQMGEYLEEDDIIPLKTTTAGTWSDIPWTIG